MEKEKLEEGLPKNNIIDSWLEEHGDPEIEKEVVKSLKKTERKRKTKKNG